MFPFIQPPTSKPLLPLEPWSHCTAAPDGYTLAGMSLFWSLVIQNHSIQDEESPWRAMWFLRHSLVFHNTALLPMTNWPSDMLGKKKIHCTEAQRQTEKLEVLWFFVTNAIKLIAITQRLHHWSIYFMGIAAAAQKQKDVWASSVQVKPNVTRPKLLLSEGDWRALW